MEESQNEARSEFADNPRKSIKTRFKSKTFQFLLLVSFVRLVIYLNKLYADYDATVTYYNDRDIWFSVLSLASLLLPCFIYALYLLGRELVRKQSVTASELGTKAVNGLMLIPWQIKRQEFINL